MRQFEKALAPFFGRDPQEFGIPERPSDWPHGVDKDTRQPKPPSRDPADVLHDMEVLYAGWLRNPWAKYVLKIAREPMRIFREQLHLMMLAYSQAISNYRAGVQQDSFTQNQMRQTVLESRELRLFLAEHFPAELERADAGNLPLFKVCETIMLDLQARQAVSK